MGKFKNGKTNFCTDAEKQPSRYRQQRFLLCDLLFPKPQVAGSIPAEGATKTCF
jgi:hypothetical protein